MLASGGHFQPDSGFPSPLDPVLWALPELTYFGVIEGFESNADKLPGVVWEGDSSFQRRLQQV